MINPAFHLGEENTVKTHVTPFFNKLGVDSRARVVAAAREGLLDWVTGHSSPDD
jgi:ATP/maltotriose-dependent transcriptional regulator MalT